MRSKNLITYRSLLKLIKRIKHKIYLRRGLYTNDFHEIIRDIYFIEYDLKKSENRFSRVYDPANLYLIEARLIDMDD